MADLTSLWHFNRKKLADQIAKRLINHERVAMFGPRQTGKTTLLRDEVLPAAEKAGLLAIYIDCWAEKSKPLESINYALRKKLESLTLTPGSRLGRLAKTPVKRVAVLGTGVDLGEVAARTIPASPYLALDALLTHLIEISGKDIALVLDEFQAIAEAKDADDIAAAIRSALTQASAHVGVVFSGSSQHLLLEMFSRAKTPLYNFANAEPYPLLREDLVGHVAKKYADATKQDMNQAIALRVLEGVGHQPAAFLNAVGNAMSNPRWTVEDGLSAMLDHKVASKWSSAWFGLTDLHRFVLRGAHEGLQMTSAATLERAASELSLKKVGGSTMMRAIDSLIDQGLLERDPISKRPVINDPVMVTWLDRHKELPVQIG